MSYNIQNWNYNGEEVIIIKGLDISSRCVLSNDIVSSRHPSLSLFSEKLWRLLVSQINENDTALKNYFASYKTLADIFWLSKFTDNQEKYK